TYQDQGQTLTDIPILPTAERALLVYNVADQTFQLRLQRAGGDAVGAYDLTPASGTAPPFTTTTRQLRARMVGFGLWGGIDLMSRADWIGVDDNPFINQPRGVSYDLSTARMVRWSRQGHPPVQDEPAVRWLMDTIAAMRILIYTDDRGVIHF